MTLDPLSFVCGLVTFPTLLLVAHVIVAAMFWEPDRLEAPR